MSRKYYIVESNETVEEAVGEHYRAFPSIKAAWSELALSGPRNVSIVDARGFTILTVKRWPT